MLESGGAESRATRKREGVLGQLVSKLVVCMELWFLLLASPLPEMPNNQGSWGVEALPRCLLSVGPCAVGSEQVGRVFGPAAPSVPPIYLGLVSSHLKTKVVQWTLRLDPCSCRLEPDFPEQA